MPTLEFKGKAFVHSHHLTVPFRELVMDGDKSCPPPAGSAELHSAVSRICNPQTVENSNAPEPSDAPPSATRRHGRMQSCATAWQPSLEDNLIIHGDNLHALKALLPVYAGKVDCIYIDPPYNTGNEGWCYNDAVRSPLMREWLKKAANPVDKEDLERHDKWLCMMWPRLQLLRELLAEDGAIFVSIDDNEVHRLRGLMDEVFGQERFIAQFAWKSRVSEDTRALNGVSNDHEYVLCYAKTESIRLAGVEKDGEKFDNADDDKRGPWRSADITGLATKEQRPNLHYDLINPGTSINYGCPPKGWRYDRAGMKRRIDEKRILWPKEQTGRPRLKLFEREIQNQLKNISSVIMSPTTRDGTKEVNQIMGDGAFDFPKPYGLVEQLIAQVTEKDSLILDSFAGSGTTAHAVLALNKKDGGHRKFILVETEDYADPLTAERVRRVIHGYKFEGTQREELLREPLNWTKLQKAAALVEKAESIAQFEGTRFDRVTKSIEDGALVVTGEKRVTEQAEGLGGSFTFCTLGEEMTMEKLLGSGLPTYEALAKYVFFTATGRTLPDVAQISNLPYRGFAIREPSEPSTAPASTDAQPSATRRHGRLKICATEDETGFIGETDLYRVHLLYRADKKWLASNDAALNESLVTRLCEANTARKRVLVFASAKFMSQRELTRLGVDFCQLPYTIHRILGE